MVSLGTPQHKGLRTIDGVKDVLDWYRTRKTTVW
jgi:hypothetical protein